MKADMTLDEYRAWLKAQGERHKPPPDDREHREQAALFEWAAYNEARIPELALLYAVPNGGARHPMVAAKMKAEGVKAGVPDMFLPVARRGWHGLYMELKVDRNKPTARQLAWHTALKGEGYCVDVSYGWQEAASKLLAYLGYDFKEFGL